MGQEQQPLETRKTDIHLVDVRNITVQDGFNVRKDYGEADGSFEWLKNNIKENGVKNPIRCYRKNGKYILVDGHRRIRACMQLLKEEGIEMRVRVNLEEKGTSREQRVIDMMTLNEGKRLNPLEEAEAVNRLIQYGLEEIEISKKIGKTLTYISNLKLLQSAPEHIKKMVRSEQISSTLLLELMRETEDFDQLQLLIGKAYTNVATQGGGRPVKITKKDINKAQKKNNSVSALKKAFKTASKGNYGLKLEKKELFDFATDIIEGKYTKEDLMKMFFEESEDDKQSKPRKGKDVKEVPFESANIDSDS